MIKSIFKKKSVKILAVIFILLIIGFGYLNYTYYRVKQTVITKIEAQIAEMERNGIDESSYYYSHYAGIVVYVNSIEDKKFMIEIIENLKPALIVDLPLGPKGLSWPFAEIGDVHMKSPNYSSYWFHSYNNSFRMREEDLAAFKEFAAGLEQREWENTESDMEKEISETKNNKLIEHINSLNEHIKDVIIGDTYTIFLLSDGTVWSYGQNEEGMLGQGNIQTLESPEMIDSITNIKSIFKNDLCIYALSFDGYVYAWGSNKYCDISFYWKDRKKIFPDPIKLDGLNAIVTLDAKNSKAYATDKTGKLYSWGKVNPDGLGYFGNIEGKGEVFSYPNFPEKFEHLTLDTKAVFCGSGNYDYFTRKDGSVYSILGEDFRVDGGYPDCYIFPGNVENTENPRDKTVRINKNTELGIILFYEVENVNNPKLISSDAYTMFYLDENNDVYYWNSNRIKYKYEPLALVRTESPYDTDKAGEDYRGEFVKITDNFIDKKIIDVKSGTENTIFLTEDGEVWISKYIISKKEDVMFHRTNVSNPEPSFNGTIENMPLYTITFEKVDVNHVTHISTDGKNTFLAMMATGDFWYWNLQSENESINLHFIRIEDIQ